MIRITQLNISERHTQEDLIRKAAGVLGVDRGKIQSWEILRRSVDARKKPEIRYVYTLDVCVEQEKKVFSAARAGKNRAHARIELVTSEAYRFPQSGERRLAHPPVVVGMGPAGLFCAYYLALHGYRPILLERGRDVDSRRRDVERFWREGVLDENSNVPFGEGGAGTFSDGKLNTLVKDPCGRNREVLRTLVRFGAKPSILYEAKPHIGTDVLADAVRAMREEILRLGGAVYFESRVEELLISGGSVVGVRVSGDSVVGARIFEDSVVGDVRISGGSVVGAGISGDNVVGDVRISGGSVVGVKVSGDSVVGAGISGDNVVGDVRFSDGVIPCEQLVLAIGHSARDTFQMLYEKQVPMKAKPFAVGLRVEHPQEIINLSQYGRSFAGELGAAAYKVTAKASSGRGVYSFCMCPGGYVVNASSEEGCLAVNGMSYSGRDGTNANSAIIVTVTPEDFRNEADAPGGENPETDPLAGVRFQRELERRAYALAGGKVPAQRYGVFREQVLRNGAGGENTAQESAEADAVRQGKADAAEACREAPPSGAEDAFLPAIKGEYAWADVSRILPPGLNRDIVEGMTAFGRQIRGFDREDVILTGVESRTSSPVRILRDEETLESALRGLYPCGEGAGYAGGITSAAMDGLKVAERIASEYAPFGAENRGNEKNVLLRQRKK